MRDPKADTVAGVLRAAGTSLRDAGIESAELDARLLLLRAVGKEDPWLFANRDARVDAPARARFADLLARRVRREPISQILGTREFWSLPFTVSADVLTPRPDSETLIEAVLEGQADRQATVRILDLGTGSGCLLLSLLSELPNAIGTGVDRSDAALDIARRNAARLGLADRASWRAGNWCDGLSGTFDVIVSNPPYIETAELARLDREVSVHEPRLALDGGSDGLAPYRAILPDVSRLMAARARLVFEIGAGQEGAVERIAEGSGLGLSATFRDLAGHVRVLDFGTVQEG